MVQACNSVIKVLGIVGLLWGVFAPLGLAGPLRPPCQAEVLTLGTHPASPLSPRYTISSFPQERERARGCFAAWLPLRFEPLLLFQTIAHAQARAGASSGLLSKLQPVWEQNLSPDSPKPLKWVGFSFGNVATLEAERETIVAFLEKVANNLIPSEPAGTSPQDMDFTLNLNQVHLSPQTLLESSGAFSVDTNFNLVLEDLTIKVSNGTISGETQLNPEDLSIEGGAVQINLDIGNTTLSSQTTFEKDHGITKQMINMTAGLGRLHLSSQVTLSLDSSEFRLGASIADLAITTITTVDASGQSSQTFELQLDF